MPSLSLLHTLGIPIVIVAVASSQVAPHLSQIHESFFETLSLSEQVSFLAILFALLFAAVASSHVPLTSLDGTAGGGGGVVSTGVVSTRTTAAAGLAVQQSYPLDELDKVQTDRDKFVALYPMLREEVLQHMQLANEMPPEALAWCQEMMDYNVPGGKLNRGVTVITVYRALLQGRPLTQLEVARAAILGWTIEFLQAFFLVADDVMDDSKTRRGQPCWYKLPKVKMIAINDAFLLESYVFTILRRHFGHELFYFDLIELMRDVIQKTEFGQLLDLTSQPADATVVDLDRFTLDRYQLIVKYKTAFYSFYLPVTMGMILAGSRQPEAYRVARSICCRMGEYFQIQDDYLDCFGDPKTIGKVGTDIQDNKCSWLVVQALQRCTPEQKKVLQDNYGQWDDEKVAVVKSLYRDLELPKVFEDYEEKSYQDIQAELDKLTTVPREVFEVLLKKIYKRSK